MGISELSLDKLRNNPNVKSIKKAYALNGGVLENDSLVKGLRDFSVFPQNNNFNWNNDFTNPVLSSVTPQPFVGGDPNMPSGDTDWQEELYETGYIYNNEISVQSDTKNSTIFIYKFNIRQDKRLLKNFLGG